MVRGHNQESVRKKEEEWMLGSFAFKAIAVRKKAPWGQERQRFLCYHYPPSLSIRASHNKSTWKENNETILSIPVSSPLLPLLSFH